LHWETFTDAADEAGMSRRYGGIHFQAADLAGRLLGRVVAFESWSKAQTYFNGSAGGEVTDDMTANRATGNLPPLPAHPAN
jgi:hypothetical protein